MNDGCRIPEHRHGPQALCLLVAATALAACGPVTRTAAPGDTAGDAGGDPLPSLPLRYLAINAGNASPQYGCWEYKLCRAQDVLSVRTYIADWQPDVIMISEVLRKEQLTEAVENGPILPPGYDGRCGESRDRTTGDPATFDADGASHEHECVAWRADRLTYVADSARSAYGRNDATGLSSCAYDFTGFRVKLQLEGGVELTPVTVHPDSQDTDCRVEEIARYWAELAQGDRVIIGGDWNTEDDGEIQWPVTYRVNYSNGQHWDLAFHPDEYSADYALGTVKKRFDHAYSSFGGPCIDCSASSPTGVLAFGSALGGFDDHPRADGGEGLDHRQILVDMLVAP